MEENEMRKLSVIINQHAWDTSCYYIDQESIYTKRRQNNRSTRKRGRRRGLTSPRELLEQQLEGLIGGILYTRLLHKSSQLIIEVSAVC
jgi:hypothetical protein